VASLFIPVVRIRFIVARVAVKGLYPWARLVQARAQSRAAVRTGRMRSRIRIVSEPDSLRIVTDATNHGFVYAALQEKRRPYLRPAIRR
jgi:hypothetical protein